MSEGPPTIVRRSLRARQATNGEATEMSFEDLKSALANGTGFVEVDVEGGAACVSNDPLVARQGAIERAVRITAGEREARLYMTEPTRPASLLRSPDIALGVTLEQARELLSLGAKWVGPDVYRPD